MDSTKSKAGELNRAAAHQPGSWGNKPAPSNAGGDPAQGRSKRSGQEMPTGGLRGGIDALKRDHAMSPAGQRNGKYV